MIAAKLVCLLNSSHRRRLRNRDRSVRKMITASAATIMVCVRKATIVNAVAVCARPMAPVSFEDKLSKFLKDSDDRMLDLKRNTESKRGGRGARRDK